MRNEVLMVISTLSMMLTACGMPRDPAHTLQRVRQYREVRVGVSENAPWVVRTPGEPAGAEVEPIRQFASGLGAKPVWIWGTEQQHMEALKAFQMDLALGGIDNTTPYNKTVGFTRPYFEERPAEGPRASKLTKHVIAVPPGENGWLKQLEEFLFQHRSEVRQFLSSNTGKP